MTHTLSPKESESMSVVRLDSKNKLDRLPELEAGKQKSVGDHEEEFSPRSPTKYSPLQCVSAAMLYALSGIGITFINKFTLSFFKFPSPAFVAFCQLVTTIVLVGALKALRYVDFEDVSISSCRRIMPMPIFFLGNAVCSLGGTKMVTIPTFSALRKFSILLTMILEKVMLNRTSSRGIQFSVFLMILGAFVASAQDLNFDALGYLYVMGNNLFTAGHFIVTKQKTEMASFGSVGSLFYCALIALPISFVLCLPELHNVVHFSQWSTFSFLLSFVLSTVMGCLVTFSTILCTKVNSGLTTSVVGCLRNVVPVYVGMLQVFEYSFNGLNFTGHTISVMGAILYSALKLSE
eukprot:GGOE01019512.1.p1 GENE.GGOE01019512.1~~GGOE01019512.1.p1  ORF type:complete len:349 (+),score=131.99 GGOE01019512.1:55-1101(+)